MPEELPRPAVQDESTRKLKELGLTLVGVGLIVELHFFIIFQFSGWLFLGGMVLCGIGLACYAKSKGLRTVRALTWSVYALVLFLGPFLAVIGIIDEGKHKRITAIVRLVDGLAVVAILGILAAIAIPNFMTYGAKARTSEAKVGLGGIFTTATSYFKENGTYEISDIKNLGYAPAGTPRYTFWYSVKGVPTRINVVGLDYARGCDGPPTVAKVAASATGFTAAARGNMDADETCDEWSINDARILTNTLNDVTH